MFAEARECTLYLDSFHGMLIRGGDGDKADAAEKRLYNRQDHGNIVKVIVTKKPKADE